MRGGSGSASTKRLCVLLLTLLCVATQFQGIVCPGAGGRGGGGAGDGEGGGGGAGDGEGVGGGAGEGGEAGGSGGSRSGGGDGWSTWWPSTVLSTGVAAAPGVHPNTAAGSRGRGVWRVSGAAAALASAVLAWR
jgi:hypothetical protein